MFRLLISLFIFQAVAGGKWCEDHPEVCTHKHNDYHTKHHDYHIKHQKDSEFHEVSWDFVNLSRKAQRMCQREVNAIEFYGSDIYRLFASFQNFSTEDITVKIKHRVLFVQAYNETRPEHVASILKILPDFVNTKEGAWYFDEGKLELSIPYTTSMSAEVTKNCESSIDEAFVIPEQAIDVRYGVSDFK